MRAFVLENDGVRNLSWLLVAYAPIRLLGVGIVFVLECNWYTSRLKKSSRLALVLIPFKLNDGQMLEDYWTKKRVLKPS